MILRPNHEGCIRCVELHEPRRQILVTPCYYLDKYRARPRESSMAAWVRGEHGFCLYCYGELSYVLSHHDVNLKSPASASDQPSQFDLLRMEG